MKNSWWWTEELSETCRVLFQKEIWEISASSWFYYKNLSRCTVTWTTTLFLHGGKVVKKRAAHGTVWRTAIKLTTARVCTSPSMSRRLRLRLLTWPGVALFWNSSAANTQYAHSFARADACGSTNSSLLKAQSYFQLQTDKSPSVLHSYLKMLCPTS